MSVLRLSKIYASSLLDLAVDQNKLEEVLVDMQSVISHANDNRDLRMLLQSPIVNADKKSAIIKDLYEGKMTDLSFNFLNLIISKGREIIILEIAHQFVAEYYNHKGIVRATLTTAVPVVDALKDKIRAQVENSTKKSVLFNEKVDADIIGGFVLEYDNKMLDASVSHQLKQLRNNFSKNDFIKTI